MPVYLTLEGGKVLEVHGFGSGRPSSGPHTVKFEDEGVLAIYSKGLLGWKKIYWSSFGKLEFFVGTVGVQTGGGWVGGGFGVGDAVKGALTASILNALTTKNREYAVLTVVDNDLATGAQKHFCMGFQGIDESTLRRKLAEVIPAWTEPVCVQLESVFSQCRDKTDALEAIDLVTGCLERGILSEEQAERILAVPKTLVPEAFAIATPQIASPSRVEQLKTLSDLRASGALSEEEFQAEKRLILAGQ
jgi:hypothetical protein